MGLPPLRSGDPEGGGLNASTTVPHFVRFSIPLPLTRASSARGRVIKNAQPKAGHCCACVAERVGNEPGLQYVGYQIFALPAEADAMNWAGDKERVRFIEVKIVVPRDYLENSGPSSRKKFSILHINLLAQTTVRTAIR